MICLTGDLHHMSLGTGNQKHADDTEIRIARRFLSMLEEAEVNVTFFVSSSIMKTSSTESSQISSSLS